MSNLTTMAYGQYMFVPVPFLNLSQETISNKDGRIGTKYTMILEGTLSTSPEMAGGISNIITLQNELREAFEEDGLKFELACNSTPLLICYPKLVAPIVFQPSNNNWVFTTPYTIELEFEDFRDDDNSPYIEQAEESWSVEFVEDSPKYNIDLSSVPSGDQVSGLFYDYDSNYHMMRVTHTLNAIGQRHFFDLSGLGTGVSGEPSGIGITGYLSKQAWEYAKDWCISRAGFDSGVIQDSGILNLNIDNFFLYNHIRGTNRSETEGSYSVNESWLVAISGSGEEYYGTRATEDFDISVVQEVDSDIVTVTCNGTIQGWESCDYGDNPGDFKVTETKFEAAESYWDIIKLRLFPRAQLYFENADNIHSCSSNKQLNIIPLAKTVGYSPSKGSINYSSTYDNRVGVRFISGAIAETITMDHNLATDVFASLGIIGRLAGPILQDIGTYTSPTLTFNIECTMCEQTGTGLAGFMAGIPRSQVNNFLCQVQADLTGNYPSVYIVENRETWSPPKYGRNITYLYGLCSGNIMSGVC